MPERINFALLVDGDNVNLSYIEPLRKYIESQGASISKMHLFGKLKSSYLDDWRLAFPESPGVISYTITDSNKNSTDVKMITVASKMHYCEHIENFIIMSSDQDMELLVEGLLADSANVMVAYSENKMSQDYLMRLRSKNINCVNLDELRGPLKEEQIQEIINQMMRSYIRFKLGDKFFNYDTVCKWITDRYPELNYLTCDDVQKGARDITLSFVTEGVALADN